MKKSTLIPILSAAVLILALLGWTAAERNLAKGKAHQEIHRTAETLFGAMKGSIQANLRRGRGNKDRIARILKNITDTTQLIHFEIRQNGEVVTSSGDRPTPSIASAEGHQLIGNDYWLWKTVKLQEHTPYGHGNEAGHIARFADTDIDFQEKAQLILLGLDATAFHTELRHALRRVNIVAGTGVLAALVLAAAWSFVLRNRSLAEQLERESIRAEHLYDLQLAGAGLAHETKNPLGLMRGMAQQISSAPQSAQPIRELAVDIMEQADVAAARLGEFIAFSRKRLPEAVEIDLPEAVEKICDLMQYDAEGKGIRLLNEVGGFRIKADPDMLAQILVNLVSNALNACSAGDEIRLSATCRRNSAELVVADSGPGIPADLVSEVFKPYVTGRDDGHGLGLAIVRRIVEDHGWRIELKSAKQRGTEVIISDIPCMIGDAASEA